MIMVKMMMTMMMMMDDLKRQSGFALDVRMEKLISLQP